MQDLAWLLIGWALGLLSGVLAALLVYYLFRRLLQQGAAAGAQTWTAPRVILLVSVPLALLVLVAAGVMLASEAAQAREAVARQAVRTQVAETFQRSQETAVAKAEERRLTATAGLQASQPAQLASPAVTVVTPVPPEASPTPTGTASGPELPTLTTTSEPLTITLEPATSTPRPTKRPTRTPTSRSASKPVATKQPTATPQPQFAWRGEIVGASPDCKRTQLEGLALNRDGGLAGNIWIHYWSENWSGAWARSSSDGHAGEPGEAVGRNWDGFLVPYPRNGTWHACVVPDDGHVQCISNQLTATTVDSPCAPGSEGVQVVRIVFQQN